MNVSTVQRVARAYGFEVESVHPAQSGYRNMAYPLTLQDGSAANVLFYKSEPDMLARIHRTHDIANYLAYSGLPARRQLDPRIVRLSRGQYEKYAAVYNYLPGSTLPWEGYTKTHIKLVGMAMAKMHASLKLMPNNSRLATNLVADEYTASLERMQRYFADRHVARAMHTKLHCSLASESVSTMKRTLKLAKHLPDQQPLHMDFVRSNILFRSAMDEDVLQLDGVAVSGILDFEKTAWGSPLFDIARTLAFLLVDCKYKPAEKVRKYFLHSGYEKRGQRLPVRVIKQGESKTDLLDELTTLFLLHDFYKFLRHAPYESLALNEHYVRTRDILLAKGVLK